MYKRQPMGLSKYFSLILLDEICMILSFAVAFMIRHGVSNPFASGAYFNIIVIFSLVNIILITYTGMFEGFTRRGYYVEFSKTFQHVLFVEMIGAFYIFSTKTGVEYSRIVIYIFGGLYLFTSYITRILWKLWLLKTKRNPDAASVFLITTRANADKAFPAFAGGEKMGHYQILGACIMDMDCVGQEICGIPVKANRESYTEFLCRKWCDEVYVSLERNDPCSDEVVNKVLEMGMVVHFEIEGFNNQEYPHQIIEKYESHNVITMSMNIASRKDLLLKRMVDIAAGVVGSLMTIIFTVILGPIIYIQSPGPIFFTQTRIGKNGKKFKLYKFRSMYLDAEKRKKELMAQNRVKDGMMFKMEHDPRIIGSKILPDGTYKKGIGNLIRDFSIDEFPQFFNVLAGSMSLCGTRPPTEDEWNKYELSHRARLAIKPGITGMWQVSGRSTITDFDEVVRLDKEYIKNWSLGLDFRIILKTFLVVFHRDGAM